MRVEMKKGPHQVSKMRLEIKKGSYQGIASAMPSAQKKSVPALAVAKLPAVFTTPEAPPK